MRRQHLEVGVYEFHRLVLSRLFEYCGNIIDMHDKFGALAQWKIDGGQDMKGTYSILLVRYAPRTVELLILHRT